MGEIALRRAAANAAGTLAVGSIIASLLSTGCKPSDPEDDDVAETVLLTNNPYNLNCYPGQLYTAVGEEPHLVAARLTPPEHPFLVTALTYALAGMSENVTCAPHLVHRVEVYASKSISPPASPELLAKIEVPAHAPWLGFDRQVRIDLGNPLLLEGGEHLFIAVQLTGGSDGELLCLRTCLLDDIPEGRNFWSDTDEPPYAWVDHVATGGITSYRIDAYGRALAGD